MKKPAIILIVVFYSIMLNGQFVENRLQVGIGSNFTFPVNPDQISRDHFYYPSLYGNYPAGIGGTLMLDYKVTKTIRVGIQLEKTRFGSWKGDPEIFILENPTLSQSTFSFCGLFKLSDYLFYSDIISFGILVAPVISGINMHWKGYILPYYSDNYPLPTTEYRTNYGIKTGLNVMYEINNLIGLRTDLYYQYINMESLYIMDKSFHSVNISICLYLKFLKNRYFIYD